MRRIFLAAALLVVAPALLANNPSSTTGARMVWNETDQRTFMFGGVTTFDANGTSKYVDPTETWEWNGQRWLQLFPATTPPGRSSQVMVWDAARSRLKPDAVILLKGSRGVRLERLVPLISEWASAR